MIFVYDTETTGFLKSCRLDSPEQPHIVQIAGLLLDGPQTICGSLNLIVKPWGFEVPLGASDVHGITTEIAHAKGVDLHLALSAFYSLASLANEHLVGFNSLSYDNNVIFSDVIRCPEYEKFDQERTREKIWDLLFFRSFDLMKALTPVMKITNWSGRGYKHPNLTEAHTIAFGTGFDNSHTAMADVQATAKLYYWWKDQMGTPISEEKVLLDNSEIKV